MAHLFVLPTARGLSSTVTAVSGAKAYFYDAQTSTPRATYPTAADALAHTNAQTVPVTASAVGVFAPIFLDPAGGNYKVDIKSSSGVSLSGYPVDNLEVRQSFVTDDIQPLVNPQTAGELAESLVPASYAYPGAEHYEGDVRRVHILLSQGNDFGPYLQNAIDAAPNGGVVTIPAGGSLYIETNVNIPKALELRGNNRRYSKLYWAGSSGVMLTTSDGGDCDNLYLHDFDIGNVAGSVCTALISVNCIRAKLERIFSNILEDITDAIIRTDPSATVYRVTIAGCDFHVSAIGVTVPYCVYYPRGHSLHVEDSFFNGFSTAGVKIGDGTNTVQGATVIDSRFESGDGVAVGYPGSATAYGIDVTTGDGFTSLGNNFEMVANASGSAAAHRAIILRNCKGAEISGGYMTGNGIATALIELASANALGVLIGGVGVASIASPGYMLTTSGGGLLTNAQVDHCYRNTSNTTGLYDTTVPLVLKFGGATTGITHASGYPKTSFSRQGRKISFKYDTVLTSKGSASGSATITGLPVASDSTLGEQPVEIVLGVMGDGSGGTTALTGTPKAMVDDGTTTINLYQFTLATGNVTALTDANFKGTSEIYINGSFQVA